jgi:MarR family transcriptional regulator, organic hydroperoxide resistance regulator
MFALNNDILESFYEIHKAIYKLMKIDADRLGVTAVQLKALYRISSNPNISLGDLAEKLRLTNSTVSGVIDRLVQSGLVERIVPPENRRSVLIHLTESGRELLKSLLEGDSILINKVNELMNLPKEDIETLLRLHKIVLFKLTHEEE